MDIFFVFSAHIACVFKPVYKCIWAQMLLLLPFQLSTANQLSLMHTGGWQSFDVGCSSWHNPLISRHSKQKKKRLPKFETFAWKSKKVPLVVVLFDAFYPSWIFFIKNVLTLENQWGQIWPQFSGFIYEFPFTRFFKMYFNFYLYYSFLFLTASDQNQQTKN